MRLRLGSLWESWRSSYWFLPAVMAGVAAVLAFATLQLDETLQTRYANEADWLYTGGADGARAVLAAIAGSTITVAATTFSITIAVLQLTSSQFGPRLLRNFMRDTGNQLVLGTFVATFLYSLLVLRRVQGIDEFEFVPNIAVTVAIVLAIASIGVLIFFVHHIASSIQAANVIATAADELQHAIERLFPEMIGRDEEAEETPPAAEALPPDFERGARPIVATGRGYLNVVDSERLVALARDRDAIIRLERRPGDFLSEGITVALVWPAERADRSLQDAINGALALGNERSTAQDAAFALNQIVEIAVRALSPSTNDPFTAITCIDQLGAALCALARRRLPSAYRYDEKNALRVIAEPADFPVLADAAFDRLREYGGDSVAIVIRLLDTIARVADCAQTVEQRVVLLRHADAIHAQGREHAAERDRALIDQRHLVAVGALDMVG
jgi:uncharacterized membrane protein